MQMVGLVCLSVMGHRSHHSLTWEDCLFLSDSSKRLGRLGPGTADTREAKILNRIVWWTDRYCKRI